MTSAPPIENLSTAIEPPDIAQGMPALELVRIEKSFQRLQRPIDARQVGIAVIHQELMLDNVKSILIDSGYHAASALPSCVK